MAFEISPRHRLTSTMHCRSHRCCCLLYADSSVHLMFRSHYLLVSIWLCVCNIWNHWNMDMKECGNNFDTNLRFWNHVLTWRSLKLSSMASFRLSSGERYLWFANLLSKFWVCWGVNRTWPPLRFEPHWGIK